MPLRAIRCRPLSYESVALALRFSLSQQRPSPADAKAIDEDLERSLGTGRPTVPPGSGALGPVPTPLWVKTVAIDHKSSAPSSDKKLGGRYGDHLRFQLRSNLDSRLCGSGTLEAILLRPYLVAASLVLPARTLAYGQCSTHGGRF